MLSRESPHRLGIMLVMTHILNGVLDILSICGIMILTTV